ncbi:MAG: hypothetical protein ACYC5H_16985 [Methylovirgula sp.]
MRLLSTLAASALIAGSTFSVVVAAPIADQTAIHQATTDFAPVQNVQYMWGGRGYCWYPTGWHGPGWYWCGYAWRRGFGWGGGYGWHGWRGGRGWGGHGWHGGHGGWHGGHGGWHGGHHGGHH